MTLRLVIEHSNHPQPCSEMRHAGSDLSIGRGADCDWQIEDPDMFVSRRHCVISDRDGLYEVTDASRGGLFIDGADAPLGAGNSAPLEPGMRIRLGDVVIRVELESTAQPAAPPKVSAPPKDDFFARKVEPILEPRRPDNLPEPFDSGRKNTAGSAPQSKLLTAGFDDPFTLDPVRPVVDSTEPRDSRSVSSPPDDLSFDNFFAERPLAPPPDPVARDRERVPEPPQAIRTPIPPLDLVPASSPAKPPAAAPSDTALHAAFLRGLGLDPESLAIEATAAEMEALGQRFRLLAEGLVQLLRTRTKEKSSVRVAQTVIGSADVNPLKFLATTDEALAALIAPRGRGYLAPDAAITAAFQDLNDHQMRTWAALQTALRQMIDRFDPAQFESEVDAAGLTKTLLAGGRNARLWQLYGERYREIAKSAEDRFLGAVGADFRDAYEGNRRTKND